MAWARSLRIHPLSRCAQSIIAPATTVITDWVRESSPKRTNLDIPAIVRKLNMKPTIRVEAGWFVAYLEGQQYVLGKTEAGIRPAVREAMQLCREVRLAQEIAS